MATLESLVGYENGYHPLENINHLNKDEKNGCENEETSP